MRSAPADMAEKCSTGHFCGIIILGMIAIGVGSPDCPGASLDKPNDLNGQEGYDDVVARLITTLDKDKSNAQDAARKLVALGRKSVPLLSDAFGRNFDKKNSNPQVLYYTTWALSNIRAAEAARVLLPLLKNDKSPLDLRTLAVEAAGMEKLDEGITALEKVATSDTDIELRKKAYTNLSVMPAYIKQAEKLFVDALSDPNDDIRTLAAKQCYFTHFYVSGVDKLIELAEKDTVPAVRGFSVQALARMRVKKAVPALKRIVVNEDNAVPLRQGALRGLQVITGYTLKDFAAVEPWWKKNGEKEFGDVAAETPAAPAATPETQAAPEPAAK